MQTIIWLLKLSFLVYDKRFYKIAKDIFSRASEMSFLYFSSVTELVLPYYADIDLVNREIIRNSRQQVLGCGAEGFICDYDALYALRDCG